MHIAAVHVSDQLPWKLPGYRSLLPAAMLLLMEQPSANAVDLTKTSGFTFNSVNLIPIFETSTSTNNVYQPLDSTMGLPDG